MKKLFALLLSIVFIFTLSACGDGEKAQEIYNSIGSISFKDESILTRDELTQLERMKSQKEQFLKDSDVDGLTSLKAEWSAFRQPIDYFIMQYQQACSTFFSDGDKIPLTEDELQTCQTMEAAISEAYRNRDSDALSEAITEWNNYGNSLRDVISIYREIDHSPFSNTDTGQLSSETKATMEYLSEQIEEAFVNRDAASLKSLKSEWDTFTNNAKKEIEEAKDNLLNNWTTITKTMTVGGGYQVEITYKLGPWILLCDTNKDIMESTWIKIDGGRNTLPGFNDWRLNRNSLNGYQRGEQSVDWFAVTPMTDMYYRMGTLQIKNITDGWPITEANPLSVNLYINSDVKQIIPGSSSSFIRLFYTNVIKDFSRYASAQLIRDDWGPVPFIIMAGESFDPEYPDGRYFNNIQKSTFEGKHGGIFGKDGVYTPPLPDEK